MKQKANFFQVDDSILSTFGELDYRIYGVILQNERRILDMRVSDLAAAAEVSPATIVRFCKKCGFSGLPELKEHIAAQARTIRETRPLPPLLDDIRVALNADSYGQFEQGVSEAYELIKRAGNILFLGNCRSGGLATYAASLFNSVGIISFPVVTFPASVGRAERNAVAIAISHSGSTPVVLEAVKGLMASGYSIVCITADPNGPIAQLAKARIVYSGAEPGYADDAKIATRLPVLYAIERLARRVYNDRFA